MKNLTSIRTHHSNRLPGDHTTAHFGRRNLTIAAAAIAALSFSSCSSLVEKAAEKAVEESVERAIEADTGEEVELDFDADDGTLSIETEDGSFSVDGEEGTFILESEDGTLQGGGDENGFEVVDQNGDKVIGAEFDADGDGENSQIEVPTEDGTFVTATGDAAWDLWPSEIPRPELTGDTSVSGTSGADGFLRLIVNGEVDSDPEVALEAFVERLDGFTDTQRGSSGESVWATMTDDDHVLTIVVDGSPDHANMAITLASVDGV